jgi:DNA-binding Lrp family transcriptional regulator
MDIERCKKLIEAIQEGLPLVPRPYLAIGEHIGLSENEVILGIQHLLDKGIIKRFGTVVRHRQLGYRANAMIVWDIPDEHVAQFGQRVKQFDFVTLCYRRPRQLPHWPYNLFCMIHGQEREAVLQQLQIMINDCQLQQTPHQILFSRRCFKQRGARY